MDWTPLAFGVMTPTAVALMLMRGWLVPGWVAKARETYIVELQSENKELRTKMIDLAIPAVTHAALVLESISPLVEEVARNRRIARNDENQAHVVNQDRQ